jgi:16S rRNA (cytidine1402-2'-O)-methyltransferase
MGNLYIIATPIGNLEDITIRALKILFSVSLIACEDTRQTGQLLGLLKEKYKSIFPLLNINILKPKLISYYDEIETTKAPELISMLENNNDIALVSDSGTPLISDPGYKLVKECINRKIEVVSIPGPSSAISALISSGLPTDKFLFLGYMPPKQIRRHKYIYNLHRLFEDSSIQNLTVIFFESPHRLNDSLKDLLTVLGDVEIVITRELTKIHEEIWRGKITCALQYFLHPKGEFVLLLNINSKK